MKWEEFQTKLIAIQKQQYFYFQTQGKKPYRKHQYPSAKNRDFTNAQRETLKTFIKKYADLFILYFKETHSIYFKIDHYDWDSARLFISKQSKLYQKWKDINTPGFLFIDRSDTELIINFNHHNYNLNPKTDFITPLHKETKKFLKQVDKKYEAYLKEQMELEEQRKQIPVFIQFLKDYTSEHFDTQYVNHQSGVKLLRVFCKQTKRQVFQIQMILGIDEAPKFDIYGTIDNNNSLYNIKTLSRLQKALDYYEIYGPKMVQEKLIEEKRMKSLEAVELKYRKDKKALGHIKIIEAFVGKTQ